MFFEMLRLDLSMLKQIKRTELYSFIGILFEATKTS